MRRAMPNQPRPGMASLLTAMQMLRGRAIWTILMVFQFTVGFCALALLTVLVAQSQAVTERLVQTFQGSPVLSLYPVVTEAEAVDVPLPPGDLNDLEGVPGVERAAVLWQQTTRLPDKEIISLYAVNQAYEELTRLRVVERLNPDAPERVAGTGGGWVFLTAEARHRLLRSEGVLPESIQVNISGRTKQLRIGGIVEPIAGWPASAASLNQWAYEVPALVIDSAELDDRTTLINSLWLVVDREADPQVVEKAVASWYQEAHPESRATLRALSVPAEIERLAAFRQPGTLVASILTTLFLVLAGLGLVGQAILMAESRRMEWALRLALGAELRQLLYQMTIEVLLIILTASVLGFALITPFVPTVIRSLGGSGAGGLTGLTLLTVLLAAVVIVIIAVAYPLRRIVRTEPAEILKEQW